MELKLIFSECFTERCNILWQHCIRSNRSTVTV